MLESYPFLLLNVFMCTNKGSNYSEQLKFNYFSSKNNCQYRYNCSVFMKLLRSVTSVFQN